MKLFSHSLLILMTIFCSQKLIVYSHLVTNDNKMLQSNGSNSTSNTRLQSTTNSSCAPPLSTPSNVVPQQQRLHENRIQKKCNSQKMIHMEKMSQQLITKTRLYNQQQQQQAAHHSHSHHHHRHHHHHCAIHNKMRHQSLPLSSPQQQSSIPQQKRYLLLDTNLLINHCSSRKVFNYFP